MRFDPSGESDLFSGGDLRDALEVARRKLQQEIADAPETYLLNVDLADWVRHLVAQHHIEPLTLNRDDLYLEDLGQEQVDVRHDHRMRAITDWSQPAYVTGRAADLHIPFTGDSQLLLLRTNTYTHNPPIARFNHHEIIKRYHWPTDAPRPDLKAQANGLANTLEQWMQWSRTDVEAYNGELEALARRTIQDRRERVLADHTHLDDIGIPVRRRSDAPRTYAARGIARRTQPAPIARSEAPQAPEPTMIGELYEHTIQLIRSWGRAVERTPAPYRNANEETLRDALLPMLNSHYEGAATGETFNAAGKIDILIRVQDRSIFIGECKWWSGPSAVTDALGQLFSYTTWRDTKLALIFFVSRKDPTAVVAKVREVLGSHDRFVEWNGADDERELRAVMRWPADDQVRAQLHVIFVHLPKQS